MKDTGIGCEIRNKCGRNIETDGNSTFSLEVRISFIQQNVAKKWLGFLLNINNTREIIYVSICKKIVVLADSVPVEGNLKSSREKLVFNNRGISKVIPEYGDSKFWRVFAIKSRGTKKLGKP